MEGKHPNENPNEDASNDANENQFTEPFKQS